MLLFGGFSLEAKNQHKLFQYQYKKKDTCKIQEVSATYKLFRSPRLQDTSLPQINVQ